MTPNKKIMEILSGLTHGSIERMLVTDLKTRLEKLENFNYESFVTTLESEFDVEIPSSVRLMTIADAVRFVEMKK